MRYPAESLKGYNIRRGPKFPLPSLRRTSRVSCAYWSKFETDPNQASMHRRMTSRSQIPPWGRPSRQQWLAHFSYTPLRTSITRICLTPS